MPAGVLSPQRLSDHDAGIAGAAEDLPTLVRHLMDRLGRSLGKPIERITPGTMPALEQYDWPGNIRELENVLQQGIILARDGTLDLADFAGEAASARRRRVTGRDRSPTSNVSTSGRSSSRLPGASKAPPAQREILGLRPSTSRTRMRKLGISRPARVRAGTSRRWQRLGASGWLAASPAR